MSEQELASAKCSAVSQQGAAPSAATVGEIRLSFGLFYVVLKWGKERRSLERVENDRRLYPVLTATHAPVLAGLWAAIFMVAYFLVKLCFEGLIYLFSS